MSPPENPSGKVGHRRGDPLPALSHTLFGKVGALDSTHYIVIRADARWYGDGVPKRKNEPTAAIAYKKRVAAEARVRHAHYAGITGAAELALIIGSCAPEYRCGSHACPECGRADQRWLVDALRKVFRRRDVGFADWAFTLVMPEGQSRIDGLSNVGFAWIMALCCDALKNSPDVKFAVLGFDISANDDTQKFEKGRLNFGPKIYFQVHLYGIVRATSRQAVWDALHSIFKKSENIYRPLFVSTDPFDGSAKGISYICKPDGYRHVAYRGTNGEWTTARPAPALLAREHVHYLIAMHELGLGGRIALVGLHPVVTPATKTKKRGVALRRVSRACRKGAGM